LIPARPGPDQGRPPAPDRRPVPTPTVLLLQQHRFAVVTHARWERGGGELEKREQAVSLRLVRHQPRQDPGEPDRTGLATSGRPFGATASRRRGAGAAEEGGVAAGYGTYHGGRSATAAPAAGALRPYRRPPGWDRITLWSPFVRGGQLPLGVLGIVHRGRRRHSWLGGLGSAPRVASSRCSRTRSSRPRR